MVAATLTIHQAASLSRHQAKQVLEKSQNQSKETNSIVHTKQRQESPKIHTQDLRSHIELKLEQNPRASPMGVASTTKGRAHMETDIKIVDMPLNETELYY